MITPSPRWAAIRIAVDGVNFPDAPQAVVDLLLSSGSAGVATDIGASDEVTAATGYLPEDERLAARLRQIDAALQLLPSLGVAGVSSEAAITYVVEEDWANAWKQYFKPIRIGRRFVVAPPWETPAVDAADRVIVIDPGMAFGTGTHPTTQLCLAALEDYITPAVKRVADIGTGSGILAVGAKTLAVPYVLATDVDPLAVTIARVNAAANGVVIDVRESPDWSQPFDLIVANILADTLIALADDFASALRPGGILIESGIIEEREDGVRLLTEAQGFAAIETRRQGEWVALIFRRTV